MFFQEKFKFPLPVSLLSLAIVGSSLGLVDIEMDSLMFPAFVLALLPLLIAGDAASIKFDDFKRHWFRFLYLACVSIALSVCAALAIHTVVLSDYEMSILALALLYIPATATDPVAVGAVMGGNKSIPRDLKICAEAESLLNDLFALIFFSVCITLLSFEGDGSGTAQYLSLGVDVGVMILLPLVFGLVVGLIGTYLLGMSDDPVLETIIIILSSYCSFYASEHYHASGILAIVVTVVIQIYFVDKMIKVEESAIAQAEDSGDTKRLKRLVVSKENHEMVMKYIKAFGLLAISAIFVAMAAIMDWSLMLEHWLAIVVIFLSTTVIRFIMITKFVGITNMTDRLENMRYSWIPVMGFAGVRGALSIVMLSFLPEGYEHKEMSEAIVFGVIVLSTMIFPLALQLTLKILKGRL